MFSSGLVIFYGLEKLVAIVAMEKLVAGYKAYSIEPTYMAYILGTLECLRVLSGFLGLFPVCTIKLLYMEMSHCMKRLFSNQIYDFDILVGIA